MSSPYKTALEVLRQQRGLIDQAITAMEILSGERPAPSLEGALMVPVAPAATPPRALPAAKPKADRRVVARQTEDDTLTADAEAVMKVLRLANAPMRPKDVIARCKLTKERSVKAKRTLERRGLILVAGRSHASRWTLQSASPAKEAL